MTNKLLFDEDFMDSNLLDDPTIYRQLVGKLFYIIRVCRLDAHFAVIQLFRYRQSSRERDLEFAKKLLMYLFKIKDLSLNFVKTKFHTLCAYSDGDFANDKQDRIQVM